jgi:hypothetical protein
VNVILLMQLSKKKILTPQSGSVNWEGEAFPRTMQTSQSVLFAFILATYVDQIKAYFGKYVARLIIKPIGVEYYY